MDKPKLVHSSHEFRHFVALSVLTASLYQKYQLDVHPISTKIETYIQQQKEPRKGCPLLPPMSEALRGELRTEIIRQLQKLSAEEFQIFMMECRWLNKVSFVVNNGGLEKLRQSGLYLDTHPDFSIASSPMSIEPLEAQRWIWAAGRVLNLLECGADDQPYSPLSELIAAVRSGDREGDRAPSNGQVVER